MFTRELLSRELFYFLLFLRIVLGYYFIFRRMLKVLLCCVWGVCFYFCVHNSFDDIFSANSNPLLISVVGYPLWCRVTHNSFLRAFLSDYSPMVRETGVQSQVESYQRLKKWYLMPPCQALSIIRLASRVKWSNPWNGVVPSSTPQCGCYWKGSLRVTLKNFMVHILHARV